MAGQMNQVQLKPIVHPRHYFSAAVIYGYINQRTHFLKKKYDNHVKENLKL